MSESPLTGPIAVELATLTEAIPGPAAMPGGSVYELKWDGYRLAIRHTAAAGIELWSRNGTNLTRKFPDIARAAAAQVPEGTVLDGEVVVWRNGRLDFDQLQHRMTANPAGVLRHVREHPASYVGFDVLAHAGKDTRQQPWTERRALLESIAAAWRPPFQLSPYTRDPAEAEQWFHDYRPAGIEGLVVKGAAAAYASGRRGWRKVKNRETVEVIVGAVIGPVERPEAIVAGRYAPDPELGQDLTVVGRSTPLSSRQAAELAAVLTPIPAGQHPWPDEVGAGHWGGGPVAITHVEPTVVVEVTADTALQAGRYRHPLRYVRIRGDLTVSDVPVLEWSSCHDGPHGSARAHASGG